MDLRRWWGFIQWKLMTFVVPAVLAAVVGGHSTNARADEIRLRCTELQDGKYQNDAWFTISDNFALLGFSATSVPDKIETTQITISNSYIIIEETPTNALEAAMGIHRTYKINRKTGDLRVESTTKSNVSNLKTGVCSPVV